MLSTVVEFDPFLALLVPTKLACTTCRHYGGAHCSFWLIARDTRGEKKTKISLTSRVSRVASEIPMSTCADYDQAVQVNLKREIRVSGKAQMKIADVYRSKTKYKYHMVETTGAVLHKYGVISPPKFKVCFRCSSLQFNLVLHHATFEFYIQHCCLRCDIGLSQWDIGVLTFYTQVLTFNIQVSSFKLNFTDEWLTFWSASAESVGRKESRKRDTRHIDRSTAARVEKIQMLQTQDQRFVV